MPSQVSSMDSVGSLGGKESVRCGERSAGLRVVWVQRRVCGEDPQGRNRRKWAKSPQSQKWVPPTGWDSAPMGLAPEETLGVGATCR